MTTLRSFNRFKKMLRYIQAASIKSRPRALVYKAFAVPSLTRTCKREFASECDPDVKDANPSAPSIKENAAEIFQKPVLDYKCLVENAEMIRNSIELRKCNGDIDKVVQLHTKVLELQKERQSLREQRNILKKKMQSLVLSRENKAPSAPPCSLEALKATLVAKGTLLKEELDEVESQLKVDESMLLHEATLLPNLIHPDTPAGAENEARIVKMHDSKQKFSFPPKSHTELGESLDIFDFKAGARASGHRFYYLKGAACLLELALVQYAMAKCVQRGFQPYLTPDIVRVGVANACGFQPRDASTQIYTLGGAHSNLCLAGTAEIPLAGLLMNKKFSLDELPLRMVGFSHSFRAEAGAYGALQRGLYRVHQFSKVEMYAVTEGSQQASDAMLEDLVAMQEEIVNGLDLHYRLLDMPTQDLGAPAYKKYDIEAWMPGRGLYGEISSASNVTDYQSRRLNIKHNTTGNKTAFVHTLNATACAVPRLIIAILETHQQKDGSVLLPPALHPYLFGMTKITPVNK